MPIRTLTLPFDPIEDGQLLSEALSILESGGLIGIPTETVYGLAADAGNSRAVAKIFSAKERPRFNPLICHVESLEAACGIGVFDDTAIQLAEAFWPGPLTLVVPKRESASVCDLATAGLDTIAVRIPAAPATRWLCERLGRPLAAPSANRSGRISSTSAKDVDEELGSSVSLILDAGPTPVGLESTIISLVGGKPVQLRPGGLSRSLIEEVLCGPLAGKMPNDPEKPAAPGMLASHYAPAAPIRLGARDARTGEAVLGFGSLDGFISPDGQEILNLSPLGDLTEAAANLFGYLRRLDSGSPSTIAVTPIPETGLGEAINDRLRRAAAPRNR